MWVPSALCANACTVTVSDVNFKSVSGGAWAIVTTGDADSIVKVYDCTFTGFDTPSTSITAAVRSLAAPLRTAIRALFRTCPVF